MSIRLIAAAALVAAAVAPAHAQQRPDPKVQRCGQEAQAKIPSSLPDAKEKREAYVKACMSR